MQCFHKYVEVHVADLENQAETIVEISDTYIAWNVSVFGVFLVSIFPHWDWIQFEWGNTDQKNSEYWLFSNSAILFVQTIETPQNKT